MTFRDFLRKILPLGREENRERIYELEQQIKLVQKQLETMQVAFVETMKQTFDCHALLMNERLEEQRQWQENILAEQLSSAFERYRQWENEALEAHRQWQETVLRSHRKWQERVLPEQLSLAFETHTRWEGEALEAQRQWQEAVLRSHREWQEQVLPEQLNLAFEAHTRWEGEALEAQRRWQETVLRSYREWQEQVLPEQLSRAFGEHARWEEAELEAKRRWAEAALFAHQDWQEQILLNINGANHRLHEDIGKKSKTYYWDNAYEKQAIMSNWGDMRENPEFEEKYRKLIRGLDDISIQTINRILCRQQRYLSSDSTRLDLFTFDEQEELRMLDDMFSKEILKISDEMFAFKHYFLPVNCFEPAVFYYKYCISEIENLNRISGKTIIDAGAFIGDTALIFSELDPDKIISFEPVQENLELMQKTISLNGLSNVTVEQMALGSENGFLEMYVCGMGSTSLPREEDRGVYREVVEIRVTTLDQYADEHGLTIGLIKADIEGSEPDFLKGARRVITEQRPVLMICIYHNSHDFFEIKTMLESWNLGYKFKIRRPVSTNSTYEAMLIAEQ